MDIKQLEVMAQVVDRANEIQNEIEDIECAIGLLLHDPKAAISVAVCAGECMIPLSQDIFSNRDIIDRLRARRHFLIAEFDRL